MSGNRPSWFARVVRWLPSTVDAADRAALVEMFDARTADARTRGRVSRAWLTGREAGGVLALLVSTHLARLRQMLLADHLRREVRHASRRLRRTPLLTASAVSMMAIAIGGSAVVFALLDRVVLSPLPYRDANRLIYLDHAASAAGVDRLGLSIGLYQQYLTLPSIESAALFYGGQQTMTGRGDAVELPFLHTTTALDRVLGLRVAAGRWFGDAENREGGANVVVLTHAFWRERFNGEAAAIGSVVQLDGRVHEVIGVLAADAVLPAPAAQYALPLRLPPNYQRAGGFNYEGIARLAPGVSLETARQQQQTVMAEIRQRFPNDQELGQGLLAEFRVRSAPRSLKEQVLGSAAGRLWILFAATAVVLIIAAANLTTLFVVRAESRVAESALRRALGAHPLVDALGAAAEPILISAAGGVIGLLAAAWILGAHAAGAWALPRADDLALTARVVVAALLTAAIVGMTAGLAALRRGAVDPARLMDAGSRLTGGRARARAGQLVMGVQVALATVLLAAASLLAMSALHLKRVDPGFRTDERFVFRVTLPRGIYRSRAQAETFHVRLLDALAGAGLRDPAVTTTLPLDGEGIGNPIDIRDEPAALASARGVVRLRRVSDRYFQTMGIPLERGRHFEPTDATNTLQAAVINEAMAARFFPSQDPIGQNVRPVNADPRDGWLTIVGVIGDNATYSLHEAQPVPQLFVPLIGPTRTDVPAMYAATYVAHAAAGPAAVDLVRRAVAAIDPAVAVARPEPLVSVVDRAQAHVRTTASVLALTAAAAVVLGLIGVYAVVSHSVSRRTAEIGVRMAFGADAADVLRAIAGRSAVVIVAGAAMGALVAAAVSRAFSSLVFGVAPTDVVTHASAAGIVMTLSMIACWIPARRAARRDAHDLLRR